MKNTIIASIVIVLVALGVYFFIQRPSGSTSPVRDEYTASTSPSSTQVSNQAAVAQKIDKSKTVIGTSVEGRDIVAYHYGTGEKEIVLVGGMHGGYEWNTVLLAYGIMDYLKQNPYAIQKNETVTVIPVLNPDGLNKIVGTTTPFAPSAVPANIAATVPGRFNANHVDLNRNFDCDWQAKGTWQSTPVSGGAMLFSEPETRAVRDYVEAHNPAAVVVWYAAAGGVYASSCHGGVLPETAAITKAYADASGYPANESFDFYATTGDMANWLAKKNIPAISVLLTNHADVELGKNVAGVSALLERYAK